MKTELEERLKQEAQIQAQEARSHRATVREIYQAVTGRTGEPGSWNGAKPVLALIEERDALSAQVREIPDLLTIAHMQGSEQAKDQIQGLRARVAELEADQARIDWIEKAILSGFLSSCFELDGGIHVTLERPGDLPVAERHRNTFRDAIDSFRTCCPEP